MTGISGSGKSVALHALEDAGFFCVDNLPPELLRDFLRLERDRFDRRVAVAVDVRSAGSLPHLVPLILAAARARACAIQVAVPRRQHGRAGAALLRETRRPHPLSAEPPAGTPTQRADERLPDDRRALVEAIELERELLAALREAVPPWWTPASCAAAQLRVRAARPGATRGGNRH